MAYDNPYESPSIPAGMLEPEWPTEGVFRDGNLLVLKAGTPLPPLCVRTGLPADANLSVSLLCRGANDKSVTPSIRSFWSGVQYSLDIPVSSIWLRKQRWRKSMSIFLLLFGFIVLGLVMLFLLLVLSADRQTWVGFPTILSFIMLFVGGLLADSSKPVHFVLTISRGFIWIGGADQRYLQQLPEWPAPKLSYWERFWI